MTLLYKIKNKDLEQEVFTHPSLSKNRNVKDYERLEFLGDGVVNLIVAKLLYDKHQNLDEGKLSLLLAQFVKSETLADISKQLGLDKLVKLDIGEERMGGRNNPKILEDVLESYIAASFIERGFDITYEEFVPFWEDMLGNFNIDEAQDSKSFLQEWTQGRFKQLPVYETISEVGKAHEKIFTVEVTLPDGKKASGQDSSIKKAHKAAAENLIKKYGIKDGKTT